MEEPAAFNIRPFTPEGLSEIIHMGREISNLQGICGSFKLPQMLRLEAGVISFGPEAWMGWDDYSWFYVLASPHGYLSVYLLSPHLTFPYESPFEVMKKDKNIPLLLTQWVLSCKEYILVRKWQQGFLTVVKYCPYTVSIAPSTHNRWWFHLRTFKTMSPICREIAPLLAYLGEGGEEGGKNRNLIFF